MKHHWTRIGTGFLLFCLSSQIKAASGNICSSGQVLHNDFKTGERACCFNKQCHAGFQPVICDKNDPNSIVCQRCPKRTFQPEATNSSDMKHCEAKASCPANQIARFANSRTRDTVCKCNPKRGYCDSSGSAKSRPGDRPRCIKKRCGKGLHLTLNCTCELRLKRENKSEEYKLKPCNASSSSCREKRESTSGKHPNTTCPEGHGVTTNSPFEVQPNRNPGSDVISGMGSDQTQYSLDNSSYIGSTVSSNDTIPRPWCGTTVPSNDTIPWYVILTVILIALVIIVALIVIILIKRSSSFEKRLHNSFSSSSESSHLEKGDVSDICEQTSLEEVTPMILQDKQPEEPDVSKIETLALIGAGNDQLLCDVANETPLKETSPAQSDIREIVAVDPDPIDILSFSMSSSDRQKLSSNRCVFVQYLTISPLLWSVLQSNETVTHEMKAQIERKDATEEEKNYQLIDCLLKRNRYAFETFIVALIVTKQGHLAEMLDRELTQKLKCTCPTDDLLLEHVCSFSNSLAS